MKTFAVEGLVETKNALKLNAYVHASSIKTGFCLHYLGQVSLHVMNATMFIPLANGQTTEKHFQAYFDHQLTIFRRKVELKFYDPLKMIPQLKHMLGWEMLHMTK